MSYGDTHEPPGSSIKSSLSRRGFLRLSSATLAAAGLFTAGCGSDSQFVVTPTTAGPTSASVGNVQLNQLLKFGFDGTPFRLDFQSFKVAKLSNTGTVVWEVGGLGDGTGLFNFPVALATDSSGFVYVADRGNGEVDVLDSNGNLVREIGRGQLSNARDLALDTARNLLYVADGPAHKVWVFDTAGNVIRTLGQFGTTDPQDFNFPSGLAIGLNGELHVVDSGNREVQVYSADGSFLRAYGSGAGLNSPRAIVVDSQGFSYVADGVAGVVVVFDTTGSVVTRLVPKQDNGTPVHPLYLSIDPAGRLVVNGTPAFVA